jgi:hypothetical protein
MVRRSQEELTRMNLGITEKHWKFASLAFLWPNKNAAREFPDKLLGFLAKNRLIRGKNGAFWG